MRKITGKTIIKIIVLTFIVFNIIWYTLVTIRYYKFIKAVPKNKFGLHAIIKEDEYNYSVKKPDYLSFTGNLAITRNEGDNDLIIWPLIFGGYEYGFRLVEDDIVYEIYVDSNLNPLDKDDMIAVELIRKHKQELDALLTKANEMFDIK